MENDPGLMEFGTWCATRPDAEESGLVFAASDNAAKSCSVWWAGPGTDFLDRMRAEARARGITLYVNRAAFSRQEFQRAAGLIWDGRERLGQLGFDLQSVSGPAAEFFGVIVKGAVPGEDGAEQLPPELAEEVRTELAGLLQDSHIHMADVRIEYGKITLSLLSVTALRSLLGSPGKRASADEVGQSGCQRPDAHEEVCANRQNVHSCAARTTMIVGREDVRIGGS